MDVSSKAVALQHLEKQGLFPIMVSSQQQRKDFDFKNIDLEQFLPSRRIGGNHLLEFTDKLATLLKAGLPLARALNLLIETTSHPAMKQVVQQVLKDVSAGKSLAKEASFPFVGPNCLGIYAPDYVDTFFLPGERIIRPDKGNVAFVSQSGGVLVDQMVKFAGQGIGVSLAVSIGNKAYIRETDMLNWLDQDLETKVIAFYIEGFDKGEGRQFIQKADQCTKPVVILKAGKSKKTTKQLR